MTVLITGGAGYIGGHTVLDFLDRGVEVVVVDNFSTGLRHALPASVPIIAADIGDVETMTRILRSHSVKSIVHFAAKIVVADSVADPLDYYLSNVVKTRSLLSAATFYGVENFIFSSTATLYGDASSGQIPEDSLTAPVSPYGSSKLMSEMMLRDVALAHGLRYVILRYFNVAGADPQGRHGQCTPEATHLIKVACQAALGQRGHIEIFGDNYDTLDGTCVRDYIHVSDLARAHACALDYLETGGASTIANVGYGRGYSVKQVVNEVRKVSGIDFEVRQGPRRAGDPASLIADTTRVRNVLGWQPRFDNLTTIVADAYRWEQRLLQG